MDPAAAGAEVALAGRSAAAALVVALLGVFILFGVGFAGSATLHGAAHDTRHAFAFPCH
jgi:cobalt transporter subunit CbtB